MADDVEPVETPDFLARLGLRADADARAIKRAYAREVKLIDQEADVIGFQDLRDAYETALSWAAYQIYLAEQAALEDTSAAQESMLGPPPESAEPAVAAPAPAPLNLAKPTIAEPFAVAPELPGAEAVDPDALSKTAFDRLLASIDELLRGRLLNDVEMFEKVLNQRLDDDELFNISARAIFEARIVYHLAAGWQKGNENLLSAAAKVFNWTHDRRRLYQFGHAGSMVNQAIDERNLFDRRPEFDARPLRSIMRRLRDGQDTTQRQLREDMPQLEMMMESLPAMMHLLTPTETVQQWRDQYAASGETIGPVPVLNLDAPSTNRSESSFGVWWFGLVLFIMALRGLSSHYDSSTADAPAIHQIDKAAAHRQQQEEAYRDAIAEDIRFTPSPATTLPVNSADFLVQYDSEGKIRSLIANNGSNPTYDRAVKEAILRAKPYQAHIGKKTTLSLQYTYRNYHELSHDDKIAIINDISYESKPDAPPGNYSVEFEITFNELGKAVEVKLIEQSPDPLYSKAVEQAILRAKPVRAYLGEKWISRLSLELVRKAPAAKDNPSPSS